MVGLMVGLWRGDVGEKWVNTGSIDDRCMVNGGKWWSIVLNRGEWHDAFCKFDRTFSPQSRGRYPVSFLQSNSPACSFLDSSPVYFAALATHCCTTMYPLVNW